jgi:NADH-quinone oxidoreductase subunit C
MSDFMADKKSSFDIVAMGPSASSAAGETPKPPPITAPEHVSVAALQAKFGEAVLRHDVVAGNQHIVFIPSDRNLEILRWLRDDPDQAFDLLRDVTAVDYGGGTPLQVVYQLFSLKHKRALSLKCELPLEALEIESACALWKAANWLEREVYDLFGINFKNHPDLRRILMPLDYAEGHPLRKDFPLRGRFSRAEQTRQALSQELGHYYTELELELGGESQARWVAQKEEVQKEEERETGVEVAE